MYFARRQVVAVVENVAAPERPKTFEIGIRIEAARIHVLEAVFGFEVGKIFLKACAGVRVACGSGKTGAGTDQNRPRGADCLEKFLNHITTSSKIFLPMV